MLFGEPLSDMLKVVSGCRMLGLRSAYDEESEAVACEWVNLLKW